MMYEDVVILKLNLLVGSWMVQGQSILLTGWDAVPRSHDADSHVVMVEFPLVVGFLVQCPSLPGKQLSQALLGFAQARLLQQLHLLHLQHTITDCSCDFFRQLHCIVASCWLALDRKAVQLWQLLWQLVFWVACAVTSTVVSQEADGSPFSTSGN